MKAAPPPARLWSIYWGLSLIYKTLEVGTSQTLTDPLNPPPPAEWGDVMQHPLLSCVLHFYSDDLFAATISDWLTWFPQYDNPSVYWLLADVQRVCVCVCVCVCVGKGFGHANPPPPALLPPFGFTPEAPVAYDANKFSRNHIKSARCTIDCEDDIIPLLPLRLFTPPSAEERIFNPERSSFKGGEGVLVNAHFHLCSFFPSHHATRAAVLTGRFKHPASKFPY